jgi:accessory gene regulator B
MAMTEGIANKLAVKIKNANPEKTASIEVMKYALIILIDGLIVLLLTICIGSISGKFLETIYTIVAFVILRQLSGGFHFDSSVKCIIFSTALLAALPHIPLNQLWIKPFTILSLISFLIYAPSNIDQQTRIPNKYFPTLKIISVLLISTNMIFSSALLAKVFFAQAVLIVKIRR